MLNDSMSWVRAACVIELYIQLVPSGIPAVTNSATITIVIINSMKEKPRHLVMPHQLVNPQFGPAAVRTFPAVSVRVQFAAFAVSAAVTVYVVPLEDTE
jgi:hypothetical protein